MLEQKGLSKSLFIDETAEVLNETLGLLSINEKISELFDRAMDLFSLLLRLSGIPWHHYCFLRGCWIVDKPRISACPFIEDVADQRV